MMIQINRHARPAEGAHGVLGNVLSKAQWAVELVPSVGDLITVHPDGEPNSRSWTGHVTGAQHVFAAGYAPIAVFAVLDDRVVDGTPEALEAVE